jgi:hypothetical protein
MGAFELGAFSGIDDARHKYTAEPVAEQERTCHDTTWIVVGVRTVLIGV